MSRLRHRAVLRELTQRKRWRATAVRDAGALTLPSRRTRSVLKCASSLALALFLSMSQTTLAATYFVHPTLGDDANAGTSEVVPWRTLVRASAVKLRAGDRLLLAAGQKFTGWLKFEGLAGTADQPVVIAAYGAFAGGDVALPLIDAKGFPAGVKLANCSHVELRDISITANGGGHAEQPDCKSAWMRCGVLCETDRAGDYTGLSLSNVVVRDVFFEEPGFVRPTDEVRTANGTQHYGWGIRFMVNSLQASLSNILVRDCQIGRVSHTGLKFTAPSNGLRNITVEGVRIAQVGGPGVQMSGVHGGRFRRLDVDSSGSTNDSRNWKRGSGLWTWGSSDVVIERSRFVNANGPGDSAGVHIDFNCRDVIVQHNFSANNAGGFCEILGNNFNCAYRYNISVNDGHRIKNKHGAFQEGKTFWLSGYTGDKSPRRGPFNSYFYNNTIYVGAEITAKFALAPTVEGVLIANNIFYIEGRSELVAGDQLRRDQLATNAIANVFFQNNLYLKPGNWPKELSIQDTSPLLGDPKFRAPGGLNATDYLPSVVSLVKNRGVRIPSLPGDPVGLLSGLLVERDVLGNSVVGLPDLGAIEMTDEAKQSLGSR